MAIEQHGNKNIVIQDNKKNLAVELTMTEWTKLCDALTPIMTVWDSHHMSPYEPFPYRPDPVFAYSWYVVDEVGICLQKSKELFFLQEHALTHFNNTQVTLSPFFSSSFVRTKTKIFELDLKELIKYLFIFLYQKQITKLQNKNCTSCNDASLSQQDHYDGCLLDFEVGVDRYFHQVEVNRDQVCKIVWEIKRKLRFECSGIQIENIVDSHMYYVSTEQLKRHIKANNNIIPLMYRYLFAEIVQTFVN